MSEKYKDINTKSPTIKSLEFICYGVMTALTIANTQIKVDTNINMTIFSMAIILIGSYGSLNNIIHEIQRL